MSYIDKNSNSFLALWLLATGLITAPILHFWDLIFNPTIVPAHSREFFVSDYSGVLTDDTESYIIRRAKELEEQTKAQIVVATVPDTGSQTLDEYSLILANSWGIGDRALNNGILLLFATKPKRVRLEVGLGLEGVITDGKAGRILDDHAVDPKAARHWNMAAQNTFNAILRELRTEYGIGTDMPDGAELVYLTREPEMTPGTRTRADVFFLPDPERPLESKWEKAMSEFPDKFLWLFILSCIIHFVLFTFVSLLMSIYLRIADPETYRKLFPRRRGSGGSSYNLHGYHSSGGGGGGWGGGGGSHGGGGSFGGGGASR